ncbi:uncharacterized protein METZ01_LOCUS492465, partial [marine metagenome]
MSFVMSMRFGWICPEPLVTLWLLMLDYFIRRFLLIPPTLLGISFMVFLVTRAAPGGPIEQAMMQMQQMSEEGSSGGQAETGLLDEEQKKDLERYYGLDKPVVQSYFIWLGFLHREKSHREMQFEP